MGYRGKVAEQARARELRAQSWTLLDIATELGVSKSSASIWTRDVEFTPNPRRTARRRGPSVLQKRKQAEIDEMNALGRERLGTIGEEAFLAAGAALYAGDGGKTEGMVAFANSNPDIIRFFCRWLREFFAIDERRLSVRLYLHDGLDLDAANEFWSELTAIPVSQFHRPYRAVADPSIRHAKHVHGCCHVRYCCTRTHREVMGQIGALLLSCLADPG